MAHIVPHHGEAVFFHVLLHGVGDVGDPVTKAGKLHPFPEGLLRDGNEFCRLVADLPARKGGRTVTVEPANIGAHIYTDDVAFLQDLVELGIPWMTSSFTEMQADAGGIPTPGGPGKCRNEGMAPCPSMNLRTAVSISRVVTPGRTILPASARAAAVICPARRIPSISLGWLQRNHILKAPVR